MTKKCTKCNIEKEKTKFFHHPATKDGFQPQCKSCERERKQTPEYKKQHSEHEKIRYHTIEGKQKRVEYQKTPKYKEWAKTYVREYYNNRRKTDSNFRILCNLRRRINHVIKDNYKSETTMELLGCELENLKKHLESKFTDGMTWNNYGKWHIDHKLPCSLFDLSKLEEQRKCFHYSNLQPLWATDNIRKSLKIKRKREGNQSWQLISNQATLN